MPETQGLRETKKRAARLALETAAIEMFLTRGFAGTTVDQIAAAANLSRSTFFRYFPSKDAVLFSTYDTTGEELSRILLERPRAEPPLRAFEEAFVALAQTRTVEERLDLADARRRLLLSDPTLMARSRELTQRWELKLAETLARRQGLRKPRPEHLLAASVGVAVAQRVGDELARSGGSSVETIIRENFAQLRELARARVASPPTST